MLVDLLNAWLGQLLDVWLLGCALIAGGATEFVMRITPEGFTRQRWGAIACVVAALVASALEGSARGVGWGSIIFRGFLAAALAGGLYGWAKNALKRLGGGSSP